MTAVSTKPMCRPGDKKTLISMSIWSLGAKRQEVGISYIYIYLYIYIYIYIYYICIRIYCKYIYTHSWSLIACPENLPGPKRKGSSSNHYFSGAMWNFGGVCVDLFKSCFNVLWCPFQRTSQGYQKLHPKVFVVGDPALGGMATKHCHLDGIFWS